MRRSPGAALLGFGRVVVPFALAVAIAPLIQVVGTPRPEPRLGQPAPAKPDPVSGSESLWDRVLFQNQRSDLESVATGRFATYRSAAALIARAPVVGHGLGVLVDNKAAYNRDRAYTPGKAPGVDNAYLTVGMKSGVVGMATFGIVMLAPLLAAVRGRSRRLHRWFVPAWLGLLALSMTQSYATSSYGPLAVAGLLVLLDLGRKGGAGSTVRRSLSMPFRGPTTHAAR
jgi:O-antigen ligase